MWEKCCTFARDLRENNANYTFNANYVNNATYEQELGYSGVSGESKDDREILGQGLSCAVLAGAYTRYRAAGEEQHGYRFR